MGRVTRLTLIAAGFRRARAQVEPNTPIPVLERLMARGDMGMAMEWRRPVTEVIGDRLWLTMVVSVAAVVLTWLVALGMAGYARIQRWSFYIGLAVLAVVLILLAVSSQDAFRAAFDHQGV